MSAEINNPFYIAGSIPDRYFCDREKESGWLVSSVTNGDNVVLISPRRMGKTSLITHSFEQPMVKDKYYVFYIDILSTTSLSEFVYMFGRCVYDALMPRGRKIIDRFLSFVKSINGTLGYDAITGMPTFNIASAAIPDPALTLSEIFDYLDKVDKPCLVVFDEFQQIGRYPEKNVEALLRSYIQRVSNCRFVYSGSERHMMMQMFHDSARPFYNSATVIDLKPIPMDVYSDFIIRNFREVGKQMDYGTACYVYNLLQGTTFYIQRLCNKAFAMTPPDGVCSRQIVDSSLQTLLEINDSYYRERLSLISAKQKPLLYAIAKEGESRALQSSDYIRSNNLGTASFVQNAARQLIESGMLNVSEGVYTLSDKFLAVWLRQNIL